jgi:hypothetical protein
LTSITAAEIANRRDMRDANLLLIQKMQRILMMPSFKKNRNGNYEIEFTLLMFLIILKKEPFDDEAYQRATSVFSR